MPELTAPIDGERDDAGVPQAAVPSPQARGARPPVDGLLPSDRWLHSVTVDELRAERAQRGLARPPRAKRVSQPPLSRPAWRPGAFPIVGPDKLSAPPTTTVGKCLLASTLAVLGSLALGALAAVAAFAGRVPLPGQ